MKLTLEQVVYHLCLVQVHILNIFTFGASSSVLHWWCKEASPQTACAWLAVSWAHGILVDATLAFARMSFCQILLALVWRCQNVFYVLKNIWFFLSDECLLIIICLLVLVCYRSNSIWRHFGIHTVMCSSADASLVRVSCHSLTQCQLNNVDPIFKNLYFLFIYHKT